MKAAVANLWADLREKRLWPLAVLLVAGLIAVPVVLKKSPEPPPPAQPVAAKPSEPAQPKELAGLATVKLEESEPGDGSSLDTFLSSNPFRPPETVVERSEEGAGEDTPSSDQVTFSDEGVVESTPGGSGEGGESGSPGGEPGSGGGETGGDPGGEPDPGQGDQTTTETMEYTYVLDVTFTNNGRTRKIKGMQKLDLLPGIASPLLLFVGVTPDAGKAVFLVDAKLETAGEGRCEPNKTECGFLYLGAGSEHMFTNQEGDTYRLRIDQIRKVKLIEPDEKQPKAAQKASGARQRYVPPLIADLVSVSNTTAHNSTRGSARR